MEVLATGFSLDKTALQSTYRNGHGLTIKAPEPIPEHILRDFSKGNDVKPTTLAIPTTEKFEKPGAVNSFTKKISGMWYSKQRKQAKDILASPSHDSYGKLGSLLNINIEDVHAQRKLPSTLMKVLGLNAPQTKAEKAEAAIMKQKFDQVLTMHNERYHSVNFEEPPIRLGLLATKNQVVVN